MEEPVTVFMSNSPRRAFRRISVMTACLLMLAGQAAQVEVPTNADVVIISVRRVAYGSTSTRLGYSAGVQLHQQSPTHMAVGDVDGDGTVELIVDFPGFGVWTWSSTSGWLQLHALNVSGIAVGDFSPR